MVDALPAATVKKSAITRIYAIFDLIKLFLNIIANPFQSGRKFM